MGPPVAPAPQGEGPDPRGRILQGLPCFGVQEGCSPSGQRRWRGGCAGAGGRLSLAPGKAALALPKPPKPAPAQFGTSGAGLEGTHTAGSEG